jgi:capsular polysaccharide transport system ATP-binding protein
VTLELRNVTVRTRGTISPVSLKNLDIRIEKRDRVALLAPPNSGLDLLVDVICGRDAPESGRVIRDSSISWPLPSASFFHKHQTFIANARFIAHLYGVDQDTFISRVIEMASVEDIAEERMDHCPRKAASRFAFALGACLPFDIYLFTNTSVGEKEDREKYGEIIADMGARNGLLIATSSGKAAQPYCEKAFVLDPAGAVYYDDIDEAIEHLQRISKRAEEAAEEELLPAEEDRVFDDF